MNIATAIAERKTRSAARRDYNDADRRMGELLDQLTQLDNPSDRAPILHTLAELARTCAHVYPAAFGPDPIPDENGRDMAESWEHVALLYQLLADVEEAAAYRWPRRVTKTWLEPHAGPILDRMAATDDPVERGQLLPQLWNAVVDHVGGQATEPIACLPAPGHQVPRTLPQVLDALAVELAHDRDNDPPETRLGRAWLRVGVAVVAVARPLAHAYARRTPETSVVVRCALAVLLMAFGTLSAVLDGARFSSFVLALAGLAVAASTVRRYWPRRNPTNR